MRLFSFLKSAGTKIFGSNETKPVEKPTATVSSSAADLEAALNASKGAALNSKVISNGINVDNLDVVVDGDTATIYGQVESTSSKEKVVLIVGNTEGISSVDDRLSVINEEPEARFYTVKDGDSLSKIAKEMYGDMMKYPVIFEANKPMLVKEDLIYPGQVLRIPEL